MKTIETHYLRYGNGMLTVFYDGPESQLEFTSAAESGNDLRLTDDEETSLIWLVNSYTAPYPLDLEERPEVLWWDRFITYILRNVTIGSDEFKKSRAGLISADLMRYIREHSGLSPSDFREMSLADVLSEIQRLVEIKRAAETPPDNIVRGPGGKQAVQDAGRKKTAQEVGPFVPQWLRLIFGVEDNRTLKDRLKNCQREESERKWYVPASCLDAVGDWKELLREESKKLSSQAQRKVISLISQH